VELANLYTGRSSEVSVGHIKGVWHDLGRESHTRAIGLRRIEIEQGHFSTPAHEHGADEEIFFVLAGEGLLWQAGESCRVAKDDCIVHRPRRGAHTLRAGSGGLDVLVFGQRIDGSLTALPRAGVAWAFPHWVELADSGDSPFAREAAAGPPECGEPSAERPPNVIALEDAPALFGGAVHPLGKAAGATATGLNHVALASGAAGAPAHCHSQEEELFVVLGGDGVFELWPPGEQAPQEHSLVPGDVVSRPAATGVAHALRPGPGGISYLAFGTREPGDMCFYPQSGRVSLRGLGIALRSPEIDYLPGR
jgi:uncharacterized cupin superfamily protein